MFKAALDIADQVIAKLRRWGGLTVPDDDGKQNDAPSAPPSAAAPADPYAPAVERIRSTSDGIVRALAAVGALLIVGVQFSNIGGLEWTGWETSNRLLWAFGAVIIGFIGVALALLISVGVDSAGDVSLNSIVKIEKDKDTVSGEQKEIWNAISADASWRAGHASFADIETSYNAAVEKQQALLAPGSPLNQRAYYQSLVRHYNDAVLGPLLRYVRYVKVRREFRRSRLKLIGAAITVGLAIGVFAWATNEPEAKAPDPPEFQTPVSARVLFPSQEEQARVRGILGDACLPEGTESIEVIMLELDEDRASVVTLPSADGQCGPTSFTVDRANITPVDPLG